MIDSRPHFKHDASGKIVRCADYGDRMREPAPSLFSPGRRRTELTRRERRRVARSEARPGRRCAVPVPTALPYLSPSLDYRIFDRHELRSDLLGEAAIYMPQGCSPEWQDIKQIELILRFDK